MIEFSDHARKKLAERFISAARVEEVLRVGHRSPDLKNRQSAVAVVEGLETTLVPARGKQDDCYYRVGRTVSVAGKVLQMRIVYDASVDVLDIYLSGATRLTSREIAPGVVADLDQDGNIISLEILDAGDRYSKEDLAKFTFERTPA